MDHYGYQDMSSWAGARRPPQARRAPRPGVAALAAAAAVAVTPVLTWLAIGDQSSAGFAPAELDYLAEAPEFSRGAEVTAGVVGALVVVVAARVLARAAACVDLPRRVLWLGLLATFLAAGAFLAMVGRTVTAGGIGVNIGGALMLMAAPVILGALGLGALLAGWRLWRTRAPRHPVASG